MSAWCARSFDDLCEVGDEKDLAVMKEEGRKEGEEAGRERRIYS